MEQHRSFVIWLFIFGTLGVYSEADIQLSRSKRQARCYHVPGSIENSGGVHQYADPVDSDEQNPVKNSAETFTSVEMPFSNEDENFAPQPQLLTETRKNAPQDWREAQELEIELAASRDRAIARAQAALNRGGGRGGGQQTGGRGGGQQTGGRGGGQQTGGRGGGQQYGRF